MCEFKLKELLTKESLLENGVNGLEKKFDEIAKILLTKTKIVKGEKNTKNYKEYYITDIEFYLYCEGHKDEKVYKRNTEAGDWLLHYSGVDICFKSENIEFEENKWKLKENVFFGGILLRGIEAIDGQTLSGRDLNGHPLLLCYELFSGFNITNKNTNNLLVLEECDSRCAASMSDPVKRINITGDFAKKLYRYTVKLN